MDLKSGRIIDSPPKEIKVENPVLEELEEEDLNNVNYDET